MRRAVWALIALLVLSFALIACGGSYNGGNAPTTSGLTKRAFVSNVNSAALDIVDASLDRLVTHRVIVDANPSIMSLSPDKKATLVFSGGTNKVDVVDNAHETNAGSLQLSNPTESFFYLPDNKHVYVAVQNAGTIVAWDTTVSTLPPSITAPNVRFLAHSGDGKFVFGFPDHANNIFVVDTTLSTPPAAATVVNGFDRPVYAVFSSDNTKAYVLNCGPECGGTTASIQVVDLPSLALNGPAVPIPGGATFGLLNGNALYVAGTPQPAPACVNNLNAPTCGRLTVVDVSGAAPVVGASYEITDGFHRHMLLTSTSRVYVGAQDTCNAVRPDGNGCLSIYNTSSNAVTIPVVCGPSCNGLADVTGMTNISGRNVVYVVEGGELHVYDSTTDALKSGVNIDTAGRSWDVVNPD